MNLPLGPAGTVPSKRNAIRIVRMVFLPFFRVVLDVEEGLRPAGSAAATATAEITGGRCTDKPAFIE